MALVLFIHYLEIYPWGPAGWAVIGVWQKYLVHAISQKLSGELTVFILDIYTGTLVVGVQSNTCQEDTLFHLIFLT